MLFTSLEYLLFLPLVVLAYWLFPTKIRLVMLLAASYIFYMSWMPIFIVLILSMTIFNFLWGKLLFNSNERKNMIFSLGIAINLICLGFFKYANLILESINIAALSIFKTNPGWHAEIILPLAISFFTFEFIHYLFEVYRGNPTIKSFTLFALFAAFFPTQIAGPIKRYRDFEAQMQEKKNLSLSYFEEGIPLIVIGLAKKVLLANNLAAFVDMGYKIPMSYGAPELWLFAYAFAFQIYFDFSAYTDIARGSAMLFGYKIPINFNIPYIANNAANFWHRWHISLSTWLRDYLYIPLGGSRGGRLRTNFNLFTTMALGGLWHGASWSFMVWGIYHGLALIIHREFGFLKKRIGILKKLVDSKLGHVLSVILTFHFVCIGWVFFRVHDVGSAFSIVKRMMTMAPLKTTPAGEPILILSPHLPVLVSFVAALTLGLLASNWLLGFIQEKKIHKKTPGPLLGAFCALLILAMVTYLPSGSEPFIYFQF